MKRAQLPHYWCERVQDGKIHCFYCGTRMHWPGAKLACDFIRRKHDAPPPPRWTDEEIRDELLRCVAVESVEFYRFSFDRNGQTPKRIKGD